MFCCLFHQVQLDGVVTIRSLAIDWVSDKFYFFVPFPGHVGVADMDSLISTVLITTNVTIGSLAIDPR